MDQYNVKQAAYEAEVKRMRSTYGPNAELPHDPSAYAPTPGVNVPVMPLPQRISELAQHAAEAGHMLAEARSRHLESGSHLATCEAAFTQVSEALMKAIYEHREGTPDGAPYARGPR